MNQVHRVVILLLVALLAPALLVACGEAPVATQAPEATPVQTAQTGSADDLFRQGNEQAQAGNFEQAITSYQAALEVEPDHVSALTNLGVAYYNTGQLDEAVAQYQKALELAPDDADIHSNVAAAYVQQGKLEEALQDYQTAIELDPTLSQAYFGLGVVYLQLGQNEQAIEAFENFQQYDSGADTIATEQAEQYLKQLRGQ